MAYLSPFGYDIFVSYARINDRTPPGSDFRWVTHFERCLNFAVAQEFGGEGVVTVWRDLGEVGGSTYFDQAISEGVKKSAIFLALVSRAYLARDYCRRELDQFYRKAQGEPYGLTIGPRSRLFNVRLQEIPREELPAELAGMEGFKLHDDQPLSAPSPRGPQFDAQFRELFGELVLTLRAFKPLIEQRQRQEEEECRRGSFTVFLAHTEGRLRDTRRRVAEELKQEGVRVVTDFPPPYGAEEHEQKVVEEIGKADLAVHMLDDAPGTDIPDPERVPGDPERFYSREQVRLGLRHAKSQLIWVPDTVKVQAVENAAHQKFLDALEKRELDALGGGGLANAAYSFIHEPKDSLKRIIMDKLNESAASGGQGCGDAPDDAPSVALLDTHRNDSKFAQDLSPVFTERGVEVRIMPEGDDPQSNDSRFADSLKQASIFIVIFGQVADEWVRARLDRAQQIIVREKCAILLRGVYIPPINGAGVRPFSPPALPRGSLPLHRIHRPDTLKVLLETL